MRNSILIATTVAVLVALVGCPKTPAPYIEYERYDSLGFQLESHFVADWWENITDPAITIYPPGSQIYFHVCGLGEPTVILTYRLWDDLDNPSTVVIPNGDPSKAYFASSEKMSDEEEAAVIALLASLVGIGTVHGIGELIVAIVNCDPDFDCFDYAPPFDEATMHSLEVMIDTPEDGIWIQRFPSYGAEGEGEGEGEDPLADIAVQSMIQDGVWLNVYLSGITTDNASMVMVEVTAIIDAADPPTTVEPNVLRRVTIPSDDGWFYAVPDTGHVAVYLAQDDPPVGDARNRYARQVCVRLFTSGSDVEFQTTDDETADYPVVNSGTLLDQECIPFTAQPIPGEGEGEGEGEEGRQEAGEDAGQEAERGRANGRGDGPEAHPGG